MVRATCPGPHKRLGTTSTVRAMHRTLSKSCTARNYSSESSVAWDGVLAFCLFLVRLIHIRSAKRKATHGKRKVFSGSGHSYRPLITREARVRVRGSTLDHEARSLSQGWPEPSSLTSGSWICMGTRTAEHQGCTGAGKQLMVAASSCGFLWPHWKCGYIVHTGCV